MYLQARFDSLAKDDTQFAQLLEVIRALLRAGRPHRARQLATNSLAALSRKFGSKVGGDQCAFLPRTPHYALLYSMLLSFRSHSASYHSLEACRGHT